MTEAQDPRVDELRRQLRSLGYLDAGVDRFVLGPARGTRRPAAIALLASVRIGLIAAFLLGPAAAVGLHGRMPGLVTGPRDAFVVALYMGVLFGTAVSIVAFAASVFVASITGEKVARRARTLSRAAGSAVAFGCLAYLTLWWQTTGTGFGWSAPVWTGFALVVAVAISLLLGHAVTTAAFAVIVARTEDAGGSEPSMAAGRSWKMLALTSALAFAGASVLLLLTAPGDTGAGDAPAGLTVVSTGLRVRLIAIDGFDPAAFDAVAHEGQAPSLAAALSGARATLTAENTRDPARTWTTIATGQPPEVHGVRGLETRRLPWLQGSVAAGESSRLGAALRDATDLLRLTRPAIASGTERRAKTMWEVAADAGLRTVVVNWWATWPAPAGAAATRASAHDARDAGLGNIVLSDRATLRLERGGTLDAEISPAGLYDDLRQRWPALRGEAAAAAASAMRSSVTVEADIRAVLQRSAELDALQLVLARQVVRPSTDLLTVYLPGLDIAQHALLQSPDGAPAASAMAARLDALRSYYVVLDRLLGGMVSPGPGEVVIITTEPGRVTAAPGGLLTIAGPVAQPGARVTGQATDVAPTVLQVLGIPISRELAGSPLRGLFGTDFLERYPVRQVAAYGRPSTATTARSGEPLDQEMIDRLRSLGYVR